jgi:alcohol dehydrogenase (cytochrome c)
MTVNLVVAFGGTGIAQEDGYFTLGQAIRGKALYDDACAACHGRELSGATASALAGPRFVSRWNRGGATGSRDPFSVFWGWGEATVDDLLFVVRTTMPPGAAGKLTDEQYVDMIAYILERNGYPPGDEPLLLNPDVLRKIPIEWRGGGAGSDAAPPPDFIAGEKGLEPSDPSYLPSEELVRADANPRDWLYHTHDYTGRRFSDLNEINTTNAHRLRPNCLYQLGEISNFQSGPIVYRGRMYITTLHYTVALDASTCRPFWRHEWEPRDVEVWQNNRGVAVARGRVVRGTSDGYLVALDAADGRLLWARKAADSAVGETFTMAPLIYDDLVLIGPAGSENAISGWVGAFRLQNGEPVWRFRTVPGAREPGDDSWANPNDIVLGGGAVWTPFSFDPAREELYVAVTNPSPDLPAELRKGDNLYTNSIVALDIRTGELRWYRQTLPSDFHDWDLTQVSPIYKTSIAGSEREVVATVGKDGVLRVLDRNTHEQWFEAEVTTILNADVPLTAEGVHACPGVLGGVQWNGPAYNRAANMLYVPAVDWCSTFSLFEEVRFIPGKSYMGGLVTRDETRSGHLTAVDASDGSIRWRYDSPHPMVGAVTTTAGGLVFAGELTGDLLAFDANTGRELLRFYTGGPVGGGVVSYEVAGTQYVAVMSGRPSPFWMGAHPGSPTVVVFTLPNTQ